jgi:outer membrane protein assembly factor BamE (lipoprotein component of BamABCDE complex)
MRKMLTVVLAIEGLTACASSPPDKSTPLPVVEREFTLGLVQKEIRVGMMQTDVVSALGSPNIVTRDADGREAWVYDKIATEASYARSSVGVGAGGAGGPADVLLLGLVGASRERSRSTVSQRTLTVILKFDAHGAVDSFSFHASRF